MTARLSVALEMLLVVGAARASPYRIEYEPASGHFPEQEGWTRFTGGGGAQRYFENGSLVLDSRGMPGVYDYYAVTRAGAVDPGPGETFVMEWRLKVDEVAYPWTHALDVGLYADSKWAVVFEINETTIESAFEVGVSAPFTAGVYHDFRLISGDMRGYALSIDGQEAIAGSFWISLVSSEVAWGAPTGNPSFSHWDYFRFGVVPEPNSMVWALAPIFVRLALSARRTSHERGTRHV